MKYTLITLSALLFVACTNTPKVPEISAQIQAENNASKILEAQKLAKQKADELKKQKAKRFLPPPPPRKKIKLKKVKDDNFDEKYMYPEDTKKQKQAKAKEVKKETQAKVTSSMTKEACIAMISQAKFDKYTAMFGNEEASIKRCAMLKAMRK